MKRNEVGPDYVCFEGYRRNRKFIAGMLRLWRSYRLFRYTTTGRKYIYNTEQLSKICIPAYEYQDSFQGAAQ